MESNKIFAIEYKGENPFGGISHFVIVVASSSREIARQYVKEKIGIDAEPIWLMNATYPTIYTSDGSVPANVQATILYNGSSHT